MSRPRYHVADPLDQILCHMRGLDEWTDKAYRDNYVTGPGCDGFDKLKQLEREGFVYQSRRPGFIPSDSVVFRCTDLGKARAQSAHNRAKPKLTRSQKRYRDYLAEDSSETFGEWLMREERLRKRKRDGLPPPQPYLAWLDSFDDDSIPF